MTKIAVEKILRMQYKYGALMYQSGIINSMKNPSNYSINVEIYTLISLTLGSMQEKETGMTSRTGSNSSMRIKFRNKPILD